MVMDARTGEVLHSRNADTRLHPASLTKMMTLYIAFEAVRLGEIDLDTQVRISRAAAAEPPSKLGLRAGSTIRFRFLIRAAAIRSANDAATAIAEAISGSEAAFARRMNRTATALGMTRTTFRNAHGLTEDGHMSTARDMTLLGRRMVYDYPQYYNIFSRREDSAGIAQVRNTNRHVLNAYAGADGIKTGYTRAAGFNLVASAQRGQERIIATVFGGRSAAWRNQRIMELLDMGFARAPSNATIRVPGLPQYDDRWTRQPHDAPQWVGVPQHAPRPTWPA
jgi:D-alanyl-D-alanine carboxypeptidase